MSEKVSPEMKAGTISKGLSTQMMYIQRLYNFFFNLGMIPPHAGIVLRIGIWNKVAWWFFDWEDGGDFQWWHK